LNTVTGCRRELALVYSQARHGSMAWSDAALAAGVLRLISALVTVEAGAVSGAENNPMNPITRVRTEAGN